MSVVIVQCMGHGAIGEGGTCRARAVAVADDSGLGTGARLQGAVAHRSAAVERTGCERGSQNIEHPQFGVPPDLVGQVGEV